jgi:prophage DNA circulation protein
MKRTQKMVLAIITTIGIGAMASSYATGIGMESKDGCVMPDNITANANQVDNHLAQLKKDLSIGSKQDAAWAAFAKTIKQQKTEMMSAMQERMQQSSSAQSTQHAPDWISERTQLMKQRLAGMETVAAAMKQLYAVLTSQQKEILDAHFGQNMPMQF